MGGDHRCPVCQATFTRPQHVARHMRSHTGDRPYKCTHCGDQFARSDLLSRHVSKCHPGAAPINARSLAQHVSDSEASSGGKRSGGGKDVTGKKRKNAALSASRATTSKQSCDQCVMGSLPCDGSNPCGKCMIKKQKCSYIKFHRQTAPVGPGHRVPASANSSGSGSSSKSNSISYPASYDTDKLFTAEQPQQPWQQYGGLHSQSAVHHDPRMYAARQHAMLQDSPQPIHLDISLNNNNDNDNNPNSSTSNTLAPSGMTYDLGSAPFSFNNPTGSASYLTSSSSRPSTSHYYEDTSSLTSLASLSSLSPPLPTLATPQPQSIHRLYPSTQEVFLRPGSTHSTHSSGSGGSSRSHSVSTRASQSPSAQYDTRQSQSPAFDHSPHSSQFAPQASPFRYGIGGTQPSTWVNPTHAAQYGAVNFVRRSNLGGSDYGSSSGYSDDGHNNYDSRPSSAYDSRPSSSASHTSSHRQGQNINPVGGSFEILSLEEQSNSASQLPNPSENKSNESAPFFTTEAMRMPPADPNATPMPISMSNVQSQSDESYPGRGRMHLDFGSRNNHNHMQQYDRPPVVRYPSGRSTSVSAQTFNAYDAPMGTPGRETETKELREFWKQYMRTPLTGPSSGENSMMLGQPPNQTQARPVSLMSPLRVADDPMDGGTLSSLGGALGMMSPRGRARVNSMPSGKTPVFENPEWGNLRYPVNREHQQTQQRAIHMHGSADDLRSYEAAVLARKAPTTLNLVPKRRKGNTPEAELQLI